MRTLFALCGVVISALLLFVSISGGMGIADAIMRSYEREDWLRLVTVRPDRQNAITIDVPAEKLEILGEMSDDRRNRLRNRARRRYIDALPKTSYQPKTPLTQKRLESLRNLDHVERIIPRISQPWQIKFEEHVTNGVSCGVEQGDRLQDSLIVAGSGFSENQENQILVHEFLVYDWGIVDEVDIPSIIGKRIYLETLPQPNADTVDQSAHSYQIVGVFRRPHGRELGEFTFGGELAHADVLLPIRTATELYFANSKDRDSLNEVMVIVDQNDHVREVVESIKEMGLRQTSLVAFLDRILANTMLITVALTSFALVAVGVASIGIANIIGWSVVERTPEIGVMKSLGAHDRQIRSIFVTEGTILGASGAVIGEIAGWCVMLVFESSIQEQLSREFRATFDEQVFTYPIWLAIGVPFFCSILTTVACAYPAWHAARIDPVEALRSTL